MRRGLYTYTYVPFDPGRKLSCVTHVKPEEDGQRAGKVYMSLRDVDEHPMTTFELTKRYFVSGRMIGIFLSFF